MTGRLEDREVDGCQLVIHVNIFFKVNDCSRTVTVGIEMTKVNDCSRTVTVGIEMTKADMML